MRNSDDSVTFIDKLVAIASYLTFGMAGFIYIIICAFCKINLKNFLRYHLFQSIFLVMLAYVIKLLLGLLFNVLMWIPIIKNIASYIIFYSIPVVNFGIYLLIVYLVITTLQGKLSYIPWVSNIIDSNSRR